MTTKVTHSLEVTIRGLSFDESSLSKLVQIVAAACDQQLTITVYGLGGHTVLTSSDVSVFQDERIPELIQSVEIEGGSYGAPIHCTIRLDTQHDVLSRPTLKVSGENEVGVNGLFLRLSTELETRRVNTRLITQATNRFGFELMLMYVSVFVCGYAFYSFMNVVHAFLSRSPEFRGSSAENAFILVTWIITVAGSFFGLPLLAVIKRAFPPVAFSGRLKDPGAQARKFIFGVLLFIVLPIAVNVFTNLSSGRGV